MWQKYFKIAERQLEAGKKTAESHAVKALQAAEAANSPAQIAQSLRLLRSIYFDNENPLLLETLQKSATMAEKAYGPESSQLVEELELLTVILSDRQDKAGAEAAMLRALQIRADHEAKRPLPYPTFESLAAANKIDQNQNRNHEDDDIAADGPEAYMDAMGDASVFYLDQKEFAKAEKYCLEWLALTKAFYGPASEPVEEITDIYAEVLEGLGKKEEAEILLALYEDVITPEEKAILDSLENRDDKDDMEKSVQAYRDALVKIEASAAKRRLTVTDSDPFKELKLQFIEEPNQTFRRCLAEMLRQHWQVNAQAEALVEAEAIFRKLVEETNDNTYRLFLMHVLLDLIKTDSAKTDELESLLEELDEHIDSTYSKALLLYRREGASPAA